MLVPAGQTTSGIDAQLEPPGQISGTVTDQQGHPLSGVGVNARGNGTPEYGFAVTDATGHYAVGSLAAGSYTVGVEINSPNDPADHAYVPEFYNQKLASQQPDPVKVDAGATTSGIDVALHAAGEISGTVTDPQGAPLAGATVEATDDAGHAFGRGATTAGDGSYHISNLEPGSYTVRFAAPGGSDYLDSNFGSPVTVTAAATSGGVDAKLAHRGLITGTVTDAGGHPLAGIIATLAPPGFAPVGGVAQRGSTTDAQGRYSINLVAPGVYSVYFSGASYVAQYYGGASTYAGATTVTVAAGRRPPASMPGCSRAGRSPARSLIDWAPRSERSSKPRSRTGRWPA